MDDHFFNNKNAFFMLLIMEIIEYCRKTKTQQLISFYYPFLLLPTNVWLCLGRRIVLNYSWDCGNNHQKLYDLT